jgi:DNA-binding CsgD family transcriptional regulator
MAAQISLTDYTRLVARLLAAALDQGVWQGFLADLSQTAGGGTHTHIFAHDMRLGRHLGDLYHGYDPVWAPSYQQYYHRVNPWLSGADQEPVGQALPSAAMYPDDLFMRTEFYADWVRPQGDLIGGGGMVVARSPTAVFKVGACIRARDRDRVEARFLGMLDALASPLAHAWEVSRRLAEGALPGVGAGASGGAGPVAVLLDAAGRLRHATPAAETALVTGRHLRLTATGAVRLTDAAADLHLSRAVAAVARGAPAWWQGPCGDRLAAISGLPGGVPGDGVAGLILGSGHPAVLVVLTDPPVPDAVEVVAARLGLTRAEAEVALALADGLTPAEVAEARAASLHTVKNQIKAALSKCGLRRQSELVALVIRARA